MINRRQFIIAASGLLAGPAFASRALSAELSEEPIGSNRAARASEAPVICVLGVGGFGCNVVARIRREGIAGVARSVRIGRSDVERELDVRLGPRTDRELSEVDAVAIQGAVRGADIVFLIAGLGGATGTRVAPLVAREARAAGAFVVAVVTEPFAFEGRRCDIAARGARRMAGVSDRMVRFSNEERMRRSDSDVTVLSFFEQVNDEVALHLREVIADAAIAT
jgi:cell division protein FtsZ